METGIMRYFQNWHNMFKLFVRNPLVLETPYLIPAIGLSFKQNGVSIPLCTVAYIWLSALTSNP